jgi:hypothetical protein
MRKIDGDALYEKLLESDVANKLVLDMVREAPEIENNKHLNGYMFDSLVYRYQLARQELAKYVACYNSNRSLEQENRNANRDIMRFVQILDELVGEGNRD